MNNTPIRVDKTYRINELPKLKTNAFVWNGVVGYTGSLIKRSVKGTGGVYKHFGFIYGYDFNDVLWIIENNSFGVQCITYQDFMQGSLLPPIVEHNRNRNRCNEIMKRAVYKGFDEYHARFNNCEHFVHYCLYAVHKSMQSEVTEVIANVLISMLEIRLNLSPELKDHQLVNRLTKTRQTLSLQRSGQMQKLLDQRKSKWNSKLKPVISFKLPSSHSRSL